jgi:orotidine-5'-phosphate decarboxylase
VIKPFLPLCKQGKTLFPIVRTANRSAPEIQDLLTGARLVHTAAADIISRQGESIMGKCGYSFVGVLAGASSANSLKALRSKYATVFLLLDGYDYPNANAKNCSYAFDRLGHGAAACAGVSITGDWKETENGSADPGAAAVEAAQRMKKNLTRYITVL